MTSVSDCSVRLSSPAKIDAHADRHDGGILRAARRIENHEAGAVENGTILEDIALDAVPGLFRRLILAGGGLSVAGMAQVSGAAKHSAAIKAGTITLEKNRHGRIPFPQ